MLYPLKFKPVFKDKIWGGRKIKTSLGLDFSPLPNCGEAWVLSGVRASPWTAKSPEATVVRVPVARFTAVSLPASCSAT